jgi:hypothetical protein
VKVGCVTRDEWDVMPVEGGSCWRRSLQVMLASLSSGLGPVEDVAFHQRSCGTVE